MKRWLVRWLRRLTVLFAAVYLALAAVIVSFIELFPQPEAIPENAVVVVLAGGQRVDGSMGRDTAERLWAGIELYQKFGAEHFVVTGGMVAGEVRPVANAMVDSARTAGVPSSILVVEPDARSTLQNAMFTLNKLGNDPQASLVLVSNRFHLPRAWASFRWAGMSDLTLYPADTSTDHWLQFGLGTVFTEAIKTIANAGRAGIGYGLYLVGVEPHSYIWFYN